MPAPVSLSYTLPLPLQVLEKAIFTDHHDPYYFVDGKLTPSVRLACAFGFSAILCAARPDPGTHDWFCSWPDLT
jgi:hypothetical protein